MNLFKKFFFPTKAKKAKPVASTNKGYVSSYEPHKQEDSYSAPLVPYVGSDESVVYIETPSIPNHDTHFGGGDFGGAGASSDWSDSGSSDSGSSDSGSSDSGSSSCD